MIETSQIAHAYSEMITQYSALITQFESEAKQLQAREKSLLGQDYGVAFPSYTMSVEHPLDEVKQRAAQVLIGYASKAFAPPGALSLTIELQDLKEQPKKEDFCPLRFWEELESTYGGEAGVEAGYREAAQKLINRFGLNRAEAVKQVSGRISISHFACEDSIFKDTISTGTLDDTVDALFQLKTAASWAGLHTTATLVGNMANTVFHEWRHATIRSRQRYPIGEDLELITYKSRFEYRLSKPLGQALQNFVGRYGR